uniref:HIT family protein n=1 Tax=Agathobacter sp. TaxID=2021311 RepID=UPI004055D1A9
MKDCNCIFCKIIAGEIPSNTIYEDEDFKVILDISPAEKGHAIVIPKEHYANLYEIDSELLAKAIKVAQKVVIHETKVLGCQGYNVLQNNGEIAGQTIFHFHLHLIPRYEKKENTQLLTWNPKEFSNEEMTKLCEKMKIHSDLTVS